MRRRGMLCPHSALEDCLPAQHAGQGVRRIPDCQTVQHLLLRQMRCIRSVCNGVFPKPYLPECSRFILLMHPVVQVQLQLSPRAE